MTLVGPHNLPTGTSIKCDMMQLNGAPAVYYLHLFKLLHTRTLLTVFLLLPLIRSQSLHVSPVVIGM